MVGESFLSKHRISRRSGTLTRSRSVTNAMLLPMHSAPLHSSCRFVRWTRLCATFHCKWYRQLWSATLVLRNIQVPDCFNCHWIPGDLRVDQQHFRQRTRQARRCYCFDECNGADRQYYWIVSDLVIDLWLSLTIHDCTFRIDTHGPWTGGRHIVIPISSASLHL
jgi:hypothetical protein